MEKQYAGWRYDWLSTWMLLCLLSPCSTNTLKLKERRLLSFDALYHAAKAAAFLQASVKVGGAVRVELCILLITDEDDGELILPLSHPIVSPVANEL